MEQLPALSRLAEYRIQDKASKRVARKHQAKKSVNRRWIPPELHLHILEYALSDGQIYDRKTFRSAWLNYVLVCRSWRSRVQEVVFQNTCIAQIQKGWKQPTLIEDGLAELCLASSLMSVWQPYTHAIGKCIRSLILHLMPPGRLLSLLQLLENLESLTLINEARQDWPEMDLELSKIPSLFTFPTVVGLYIFQSDDHEIFDVDTTMFIPRLVSRFPSVQYLSLETCSSPQVPRATWPRGPQNLIAFRSLGSWEVAPRLTGHFVLSASTHTFRVLKVWCLSTEDALAIANKHGPTLECLTIHPPAHWQRNRVVLWPAIIRRFVNLQHLSLASLLGPKPGLLGSISKNKLRHLELAIDNRKPHPDRISNADLVLILKKCPMLVRVTVHSPRPINDLYVFAKQTKVEIRWHMWAVDIFQPEPYISEVVLGGNPLYSTWEDVANFQPEPLPTLAPRKHMNFTGLLLDKLAFRHL